jgi:hypothetical protein
MKKFLSIVAVVALVFALAVPAFAADAVPSVKYDYTVDATLQDAEAEGLEDGTHIEVSAASELQPAEQEALEAVLPSSTTDVQILDISLKNTSGDDVDVPAGGIKVALSYTVADGETVLAAYAQNDKGGWDTVQIVSYVNGVLTLKFDHLCTVALAVGVKADPTQGNTTTNTANKTTQAAAKGKSPQTGYDVLGWAVAVSALVMAAGYCFVSARKVTE